MARDRKADITPAERTARIVAGGVGALAGEDVMTTPTTGPDRPIRDLSDGFTETGHTPGTDSGHHAHSGHRWMMLICCVPMVAIVLLLIASGTAGSGALVWTLGCVAMMAAMMFMMPGGRNHRNG